jgi:hypothetical protein
LGSLGIYFNKMYPNYQEQKLPEVPRWGCRLLKCPR